MTIDPKVSQIVTSFSLGNELVDLFHHFLVEWAKNRNDQQFILELMVDWTIAEPDNSLSKILVETFIHHQSEIPVVNENSLSETKEKIAHFLSENNDFLGRLNNFHQRILHNYNYSPLLLLETLQKIWDSQSINDAEIALAEELTIIGLVTKNDQGYPMPSNWMYHQLFDLKNLAKEIDNPSSISLHKSSSNAEKTIQNATIERPSFVDIIPNRSQQLQQFSSNTDKLIAGIISLGLIGFVAYILMPKAVQQLPTTSAPSVEESPISAQPTPIVCPDDQISVITIKLNSIGLDIRSNKWKSDLVVYSDIKDQLNDTSKDLQTMKDVDPACINQLNRLRLDYAIAQAKMDNILDGLPEICKIDDPENQKLARVYLEDWRSPEKNPTWVSKINNYLKNTPNCTVR